MRRVVRTCPCGGEIIQTLGTHELTCRSCGAIFEAAPPLIMVKRGRDDSVQEGTVARTLAQVVNNEQQPQRVAETTR